MSAPEKYPNATTNYSLIYDLYPFVERPSEKNLVTTFFSGFSKKISGTMNAVKFFGSNPHYSAPREWAFPIEDQGVTMCCLSYAVTYMLRVRQRRLGKVVKEYSPKHLHFCLFDSPFNLAPPARYALDEMKSNGIAVYPGFQQSWMNQSFCTTNPPVEVAEAKGYKILTSPSMVKSELSSFGAVVAHIVVDDGFFKACEKNSIYEVKDPENRKAHCVCLIGFDDTQRCWIGVNSFGTGWGDGGFFRVSYDGCGVLEYETYPVFSIDLL